MQELTTQAFITDVEKYLINAVVNDDFVKINTAAGNAVLISEAEWNIMVDAMKVVLAQAAK